MPTYSEIQETMTQDSMGIKPCGKCNTNTNNNNNVSSPLSLSEEKKSDFLKGINLGPVINLSDFQLTPDMIILLSKGLNFCPSPGYPERSHLRQDLDKFHISLRRKSFFEKRLDSTLNNDLSVIPPEDNSSSDELEPFNHYKFRQPSKWNPPAPFQLEAFIAMNETRLNEYSYPTSSPPNLRFKEKIALAELKQAKNIIIKPADKGSAVVIQNLDDYINEGIRQLSDAKFYVETPYDLTALHNEIINNLIDYLEEKQEISKKCSAYLRNNNPRTSQLYLLPKVHKKKLPMPGRPIVSANNSPTERISEFADFFLKPLVLKTKSYVRDTSDFINKIENIGPLPPDCLLCTVDVTSLYTNIPNDEGISACNSILTKYRGGEQIPSNDSIIMTLEHVLHMNNFDFNEKHYLQIGGTAMGTRVAPSFANIFMAHFEDKWVYTYPVQPRVWLRYIDDIFLIWEHNRQSLDDFLSHLNNCHHSIKFTAEISPESVSFLDTSVQIDQNRYLYTDLYCKPTDAHNYLLFNSSHPNHLLRSLPYSQLLRIRRICSHIEDYDRNAITIGHHFIRRGYPENLVTEAIIKARRCNRASLLQPKEKSEEHSPSKDLFVITHYNPDCTPLRDIVLDNWSLLGRTNTTDSIHQKTPIFGYRRNKNLKDILVHAKIPQAPTPEPVLTVRNAARTCKSKNCRYCPRLDKSGHVHSALSNHRFETRTNITCNSNNLIYCIKCKKCGVLYVGQTKNSIKERFKQHFYSISRPDNVDTTVSRHYSKPDHTGLDDVQILVLEFITNAPNTPSAQRLRDEKEKSWIHRLSTIAPLGLNSAD
jgi:hypothetical protein